jgi:hypothetical protein
MLLVHCLLTGDVEVYLHGVSLAVVLAHMYTYLYSRDLTRMNNINYSL